MRRLLKLAPLDRKSALVAGAIALTGIAVIASGSMAVASYSGISTRGQILACWQNSQTQNLRLVDHFPCHADETPVSWNKEGVKGATGAAGVAGPAGTDGVTGAAGKNGVDGAMGATGLAGAIGKDGANAFAVAVANGFEGNVTQWLASLKGVDGAAGATILTAPSCTQPALFVYARMSLENLVGGPVANIVSCPPPLVGKLGDFYFDAANTTLYGPKTDVGWGTGISLKGAAGSNGSNGAPGQSAYDLAKAAGGESFPYENEAQWLASLKGSKGDAGTPGTSITGLCLAGQYVSGITAGTVNCTALPVAAAGPSGTIGAIGESTSPTVSMTFQSDGTTCTPTLHVIHGPASSTVSPNLSSVEMDASNLRVGPLVVLNGLATDSEGTADKQLDSLAFPLDKVSTYSWTAALNWGVGTSTPSTAMRMYQPVGSCPAASN